MARQPSALRTYMDEAGELPADVLIGHVVMFTINDTPVSRDDLERRFADLGLNPALLPPEINPLDAFKKATSEAKEAYSLSNGNTVSVLCREVASTSEYVTRQITREERDTGRRQLTYSRAVECVYYRGKADKGSTKVERGSERVLIRVDVTGLANDAERQAVQDIADSIKERYARYYEFLDGNRIRAVVRDYLKFINAIELRGGVYFVHINRADDLRKLSTLVNAIGNGCFMHTLPLVDLPSQRDMVIEAFQREAQQKLEELIKEIHTLRTTRKKITADAYSKLKSRYDVVMQQAGEYLRTLDITKDLTGANAQLALDALVDLQKTLLSQ